MSEFAGQTDIFDLLEKPAAAEQPRFKVHPLGWNAKPACGWCGGPGYLGGGACRWPEDENISIGYDYCQKCVNKYGHPNVRAGGTPLVMMSRNEMRIFCKEMVLRGISEPYYTPTETPWLSGTAIQYPRPKGYCGLYQLRKE